MTTPDAEVRMRVVIETDYDRGFAAGMAAALGPPRHTIGEPCGQLREALRRHIVALGELCELVTRHEDMTECGCGDFDDWFQTWDGPAQRLHVPDDVMAEALAALAPTVAESEACAREGCGHKRTIHDTGWDAAGCMWDACPCSAYLAPSPATEAERRGDKGCRHGEVSAHPGIGALCHVCGAWARFAPSPATEAERRGGER